MAGVSPLQAFRQRMRKRSAPVGGVSQRQGGDDSSLRLRVMSLLQKPQGENAVRGHGTRALIPYNTTVAAHIAALWAARRGAACSNRSNRRRSPRGLPALSIRDRSLAPLRRYWLAAFPECTLSREVSSGLPSSQLTAAISQRRCALLEDMVPDPLAALQTLAPPPPQLLAPPLPFLPQIAALPGTQRCAHFTPTPLYHSPALQA